MLATNESIDRHMPPSHTMQPLRIRIDKTARAGETLRSLNCNLACIWCHGDFFHHELGAPAISNAEIVNAVKLIIAASSRPNVEIKISGQGEPTLVGVSELRNLISQLRLIPQVSEIKLVSNGILIEGMIGDLITAGLDAVTVSINSLKPEVYSLITQHNCLSRAISGVKAVVRTGIRAKVNVIYSKLNAAEVFDFVRFSGMNGGIVVKFFDLLITRPVCEELYLPLSNLKRELEPLATSKRTLVMPYRSCEYCFAELGAIVQVKTAGRINECPNTACQHRARCLEGCRSAVRISQDGTLHPCGVRTDNVIAFNNNAPTIEQVREALLSGGKNG